MSYIDGMAIRRAAHAVYDLTYHVVWIPKYRKHSMTDEVAESVKEVFHWIAEQYDMEIDRVEVVEDHVHNVDLCSAQVCSITDSATDEEYVSQRGISKISLA